MKRLLYLLLFLAQSPLCHAQKWNCFVPGTKQYFINSHGYLRGIRLDSFVTAGVDTVYYPFHTPRGNYHSTVDSNAGSWLGKEVRQQPDGTFIFDNLWQKPITIKTWADTVNKWFFYTDSNRHYKAGIASIDTMSILGSLDSIKKIWLLAFIDTLADSTDPNNNLQIILSKNHGFVQVFDLFTFPYHKRDTLYGTGYDYFLDEVVKSSPSIIPDTNNSIFRLVNFFDPNNTELNEFTVGDAFNFSAISNDYTSSSHNYTTSNNVRVTNRTVIAPNIVQYTKLFRIEKTYTFPPPPSDYQSYSGTTLTDAYFLIDTSKMPEEKKVKNFYWYYPNDTSHCVKSDKYKLGNVFALAPDSLGEIAVYKIGFGRIEYHKVSDTAGINYYEVMTASIKNTEDCGNYQNLSINNSIKSTITVSPNPANEQINIYWPDNSLLYTITLYNAMGQCLVDKTSVEEHFIINVSQLPAGVYFLDLKNNAGQILHEKIIIAH